MPLTAFASELDADVFELRARTLAQVALVCVLASVRAAHYSARRVVAEVVARFRTLCESQDVS